MNLNWNKGDGLLPAIIQDAKTKDVLMLGFMNQESLELTQQLKKVTFFSRTKNRQWTKGETSGNFLEVVSIKSDCDHDTLLIQALNKGPTCHLGTDTCFGQKENQFFLDDLDSIILSRKQGPQESYTNSLFQKGLNKIAQKVGEEATEVVIAALNETDMDLINESSDLLFHLMVLLRQRNLSLSDVVENLRMRHQAARVNE